MCFVYTRYEECVLISVANEHCRKIKLNNLHLLLVHFLRNWLWKHQATRCESTNSFVTFVFTYLYMPKEGL